MPATQPPLTGFNVTTVNQINRLGPSSVLTIYFRHFGRFAYLTLTVQNAQKGFGNPIQCMTSKSSTGSDSTIDSESEPVSTSSALQENPFKTAFATPQSSVVNVVLRRAALQARATKFVECDCVNGGLCVGAGGRATCDYDVVPPQVHYFFATTSTARTGEASRTLDSGIEDLIAHIDDLDSTDPTTTSVVYLTTVGTWAHRSLKDKGLARQSDAVLHQA
ncbi:unnamed protein product [Aureobasidium pullulans]|nr:unnamed protein product [Aureobasidium pullulans]